MNRKVYRLCLVVVIAIAVLTGVLYYQFYQKNDAIPKEGTFVWREVQGSERI